MGFAALLLLLAASPDAHRARCEKILRDNIAPFWLTKSIDRQHGGYTIAFGPRGEPKGSGTKMIVTQARTVWLFSRLARAGYGKEYLPAAEHGFRFLRDRMWDRKNGGFFWEVDATGAQRLKARKHLYGQAFALYALSEYYLASRRKEALELAVRLFRLLEAKAHDARYGGYVEFFEEDWSPAAGEAPYVGGAPGAKLMNTHLHLMEALTTFLQASRLPLARERLVELIAIQSSAVVRKRLGACTDKHDADWTPRLEGNDARVSYGHDLENVWLLVDAAAAAGLPAGPMTDLFRALWDYSLRHGHDEAQGGFYDSGPFERPADRRNKVWWVQAEALVSALVMHRLTGEPRYWAAFEKTLDFVDRHQVDWTHGEWHAVVAPDGTTSGDKAGPWKGGYHQGRAMIECVERLGRAVGGAPTPAR